MSPSKLFHCRTDSTMCREPAARVARQLPCAFACSARAPPAMKDSKTKATRALLIGGLRTSLRAFSDTCGVRVSCVRRLLLTSGSVLLDKERAAFRSWLLDVQAQASQGDLRPGLFTWFRFYDETPCLCRIHIELAHLYGMAYLLLCMLMAHWRVSVAMPRSCVRSWDSP